MCVALHLIIVLAASTKGILMNGITSSHIAFLLRKEDTSSLLVSTTVPDISNQTCCNDILFSLFLLCGQTKNLKFIIIKHPKTNNQ